MECGDAGGLSQGGNVRDSNENKVNRQSFMGLIMKIYIIRPTGSNHDIFNNCLFSLVIAFCSCYISGVRDYMEIHGAS